MSSDLIEFQLGKRCSIKSSKRIFAKEYVENGIPFMRSKDVINKALGSFLAYDLYISEKRYYEIKEKNGSPKKGDVLISSVGNRSGQSYVVKDEGEFYFKDGNILWLSEFQDINPYFLTYWFTSDIGQQTLSSIMIGSAQKALTIDGVRKLWVKFPLLPTQQKIAHILSTLDDKIELNRKMNQTLEEMAQALFKSWFVDFDPVHAKAQCSSDEELEAAARELGISKEVLGLFPSKFEESELGMIPKGWNSDFLDSFVEILDSKRIPLASNERAKRKGDVPYYGATSIMDYVDDYLFDETLLLMGEDGSVVRNDGTPFLQYIWGKAWVNNHAHVMKSKSSLSIEALYISLLNKNVTMFVTGAVQPKINQGNLKQIPIINAGESINKMYSTLIEPIFAKVRLITEENKTLEKTRDTLLPKLLSGELDVSELELDI